MRACTRWHGRQWSRSLRHAVAALLALENAARAQFPNGPEFRVNAVTAGEQYGPTVASTPGGAFLVVWSAGDGSDQGIYARRFLKSGAPLGGDFRVNTQTTGLQSIPRVAASNAGFVVVWRGLDGHDTGVLGQRFDSAGTPLLGEFRANETTTGTQVGGVVAADAAGNFYVVYTTAGGPPAVQRFSGAGAPIGAPFQASTYAGSLKSGIAVAASSTAFVVVWISAGQDGDADGLYAQRFSGAGAFLGSEFRVNVTTTGDQVLANVAMDTTADFVVVWQGPDGNGRGVFMRRFTSAGGASAETRVNTFSTGDQVGPQVAAAGAGSFLVTWLGRPDASSADVLAQRFHASGAAVAGEFRLNTVTTLALARSGVSVDLSETFVIAWSGPDGDQRGAFARRLGPYRSGDVNGDGAVDLTDVLYLINHLFAGGSPPIGPADVNFDFAVTVGDVLYLINHLFAGGPAPA